MNWNTWGFAPRANAESLPYRSPQATRIDAALTDEKGVVIFERDGARRPHPVAEAQYALKMLNSWHVTGQQAFLSRAIANGNAIIEGSTSHNDRTWFTYHFDFPLHGDVKNTIHAPWWSAMAQGQVLSLMVRLHEATHDDAWSKAAAGVFNSFLDIYAHDDLPQATPWAVFVDEENWLWLEEYAGDVAPMRVLNGHIFAMYGLYDYWAATGDAKASSLFDGAATTVARHVPRLRSPGAPSWYGMRVQDNPTAQSKKYHRIHIIQLRQLEVLSGEPLFGTLADVLATDFT